ncbi:MAG: pilus assembly protein [Chloroflexota bacterium]|nr:pilus assembly protein [Chloroflexota bacterium]
MKHTLRGQALAEFALLLPMMCLLTFTMLDFGRVFYFQEAIANAAREGARYGATTKTATSGDIIARAQNEASGISPLNVTPVIQATGEKYVHVTVTYQFDLLTPFTEAVFGNSITLTAKSKMRAEYE